MDARNKRDVAIYAGAGAHLGQLPQALLQEIDINSYNIRIIGSQSLVGDPACLADTAAFFMPGGADLPYCADLNGAGNAAIRNYVESGGTYVGLCAGAYYGARRIAFHAGRADEISGPRELAFFPGTAEGSLPGLGSYYDMTKRSAAVAKLQTTDGGSFASYYHGGCSFSPDADGIFETLARYDDLAGKPPAVVAMRIGNGLAILSGIHPEVASDRLETELRRQTDGATYRHLVQQLGACSRERLSFWRSLLQKAGLRLAPSESIAA